MRIERNGFRWFSWYSDWLMNEEWNFWKSKIYYCLKFNYEEGNKMLDMKKIC